MEELKEVLEEMKEIISKNVLYSNSREKMYHVGQMNLITEILDEIKEIENKKKTNI